jgi:plastocyanin
MLTMNAAARALILRVAGAAAAILIAGCGTSPGQPRGTVATATETEYHIALSQTSFSPGTYTFVAINHGQVTHSLEITGPGVNGQQLPQVLAPGQSASMTVILSRGTYDVFCQIGRHRRLGMVVIIHVTG